MRRLHPELFEDSIQTVFKRSIGGYSPHPGGMGYGGGCGGMGYGGGGGGGMGYGGGGGGGGSGGGGLNWNAFRTAHAGEGLTRDGTGPGTMSWAYHNQ